MKHYIKQGTLEANVETLVLDTMSVENCIVTRFSITNKNNSIVKYRVRLAVDYDTNNYYTRYDTNLLEFSEKCVISTPLRLSKTGSTTQQVYLYSDTANVDYSLSIEAEN